MNSRSSRSRSRWRVGWLVLASIFLIGDSSYAQEAPDSYLVASAQHGGLYRPLASSICQLLNKGTGDHGYRCRAIRSTGSVDNIARLKESSVAFALVQSDVERQSVAGTGEFINSPPYAELRSVLAAHGEPLTILVPAESDIRTLEDLRGHRVGIGLPGSAGRAMFNAMMAGAGWSRLSFDTLVEQQYDDQVAALCAGEIDVASITIGHPNSYTQRAILECNARILPVDGPTVETVLAKIPSYRVQEISGGLYLNHAASTISFGPVALLVTRADVPEDAVEALVGAVLDQIDTLHQLGPAFQHLDGQSMYPVEAASPIHPGAAQAFAKRGLSPPS